MVQRNQIDYETQEIEETVYECDLCGVDGAENHLFGDILTELTPLKAGRVADYCDECYDELSHEEYVIVNHREAADRGLRIQDTSAPDSDNWVNVKAALATVALLVYTAWTGYIGSTGIPNGEGEVLRGAQGAVLGVVGGWAVLIVGLIIVGMALILYWILDTE